MIRRFAIFLICTMATAFVFAQTPKTARISNFEAPTTDPGGRRSVVKGANAEQSGAGVYKITKPHVDNYRADNTLDSTIDAAECFFDYDKTHDVWSDKELSMKTADGRFSLKGVGFRWTMGESRLNVSNRVEAIVRRDVVDAKAQTTNEVLKITADSVERRSDLVTFSGNVVAIDPQGEVRCRTLKVRLNEQNKPQEVEAIDDVILTQKETEARGNHAIYKPGADPNEGMLRLTGGTHWRMGDREGESDLLMIDRAKNTLRAETKVKMTIPSSLLATNAPGETSARGTTNKLTVTADTFDYAQTNSVTHGPIAIFNGDVHAVDPQASLDCELLTIFFNTTNRLARAVADRNVQITRTDGSIKGTRAVFENDEITIPGNPAWRMKESAGTAELLVFNPRTREVRALKKVRMEIPVSGATNLLMGTGSANKGSAATNLLIVTADYFTNKNNVATFSDNVRASEARGQIDANKIEVHFNSTNRVERVIADGDVIITEQKMQAIGQRADYDVNGGTIHLTGTPRVLGEDATVIAREFVIDLINHKRQPVAPFRIEVRNIKKKKTP